MKPASFAATLLLAAPALGASALPAAARDVLMFDTPPSVEELRRDLLPGMPAPRTRSIEIPGVHAAPAPSAAQHAAYTGAPAPAEAANSVPAPAGEAAGLSQPQSPSPSSQAMEEAEPKGGAADQAASGDMTGGDRAGGDAAGAESRPAPPPRHGGRRQGPVTVGFHIQFAFDSTRILPSSHVFLDRVGKVMRDAPGLALVVEGHTDAQGGDGYNRLLSARRAEAVKAYLVEVWRVDPDHLRVEGKGKSEPLVADPYAPANRRVQFRPLSAEEG